MNNIINNLYIGAFEDARDKTQLENNQIAHIINVAEECDHTKYAKGISYEKFDIIEYFKKVKDTDPHDLNHDNLERVYVLLDKYISSGENVLIHCAHGMSRSVSCVIYYLRKKYDMDTKEALLFIRSKRSIAYPCSDYIRYLARYDA